MSKGPLFALRATIATQLFTPFRVNEGRDCGGGFNPVRIADLMEMH